MKDERARGKQGKKQQKICQRQIMLLYINFLTFQRHHRHPKNLIYVLCSSCGREFLFGFGLNIQRPVSSMPLCISVESDGRVRIA